jgi:hypothetical protein
MTRASTKGQARVKGSARGHIGDATTSIVLPGTTSLQRIIPLAYD